jgi:hypothetical protein
MVLHLFQISKVSEFIHGFVVLDVHAFFLGGPKLLTDPQIITHP